MSKQFLSFLLIFILLFAASSPTLTVLANDLPIADRMRDSYPANGAYENPVGNWSYQYAPTGTNGYINFDALYDTTPAWGDFPWGFVKDGDVTLNGSGGLDITWQHPIVWNIRAVFGHMTQNDAVYTYTAPADGVVEVTNTIEVFGSGAELTVYKESGGRYVAIGPEESGPEVYPEGGTWQLPTITTAIKAGETLHFQLSGTVGESATIDPVVTYTGGTYDASLDLAILQPGLPKADRMRDSYPANGAYENPVGNWSYQYAPTGTNGYTNFDALYDTTPAWGDLPWHFIKDGDITPNGNGGISANWQHPIVSNMRAWIINTFDAVYTYTAPADGVVEVTNMITVFGDPSWTTGVELTVYKKSGDRYVTIGPVQTGSEIYKLHGSDNETYSLETITTAIKAGETLHFQLKNADRGPWHNVTIDPRVIYTSNIYNENDDLGITTISARENRPAGSDLDNEMYPAKARDEFSYMGEIDSEDILIGILNGNLPKGAYNVINNETLIIYGSNTTIDFDGYKFIVEPDGFSFGSIGEKRYALFLDQNQNLVIKNLTLEVKGTPATVIMGENFNGVTFVNTEIIDSNNLPPDAEIEFLSIQGGAGQTDFVFDGLRFESKDNKISKMSISIQAHNAIVKNSYIDGLLIVDQSSNGAQIENNILNNIDDVLNLNSHSTAVYNTIKSTNGAGIVASGGKFNILAALNVIDTSLGTSVRFDGVTNCVLLLNILNEFHAINSTNITVAENEFAGGSVFFENVDYALGTGNIGLTSVIGSNNTNLSGDDFVSNSFSAVGVNEDLLPKLNKELFVPMERKTMINTEFPLAVNDYITLNYKTSKYVIIPPGAYSTSPITFWDYKNYTIYAYGVLFEFEDTLKTPICMYDCENIAIKGLYIDYLTPPNGQATVISVGSGRVTFKMDDGYHQNLLDTTKYAFAGNKLSGTEWFKAEERIATYYAEEVPSKISEGVFSIPSNGLTGIAVGDKLAFRGSGTNVTHFDGCSGMVLEDYTIYGGSGFGFSEFLGNKSTILNRVAIVPGPAPVLPGGARGPERLLSTCDSTHSTDMRHGPQITNCVFESATDDGANINAQFGGVIGFNNITQTITYGKGQSAYNGICADFQSGDRVLIFTIKGELLCDTIATGNTISLGGGEYSVTVAASEIVLKENTSIQNGSASGNGFLIENTRQYGNWTRGFLIKALGGRIANCTIDSVGCSAIYICPEITDGYWPECGFPEDIIIENNLITNTGYMYNNPQFYINELYSTPINITGQVAKTNDPDYMMINRILVQNNVIENRHSKYAIQIQGGQNITVINNDWGNIYGKNEINDTQSSAIISTSMNIEMSGNIYPPLAIPKILIETASTANIFGTDIRMPSSEIVKGYIESVYNGNGWDIVVTLENISNATQSGNVDVIYVTQDIIADEESKTYNLSVGEKVDFIYPVVNLPRNLKSVLFSVIYTVNGIGGEDELTGFISENLYLNAAVKTINAPIFGNELDMIWDKAPVITAVDNEFPNVYNTSARFLWDDKYLYLLAEVNDPVHRQNPEEAKGDNTDFENGWWIWAGDSIQIAIEPGRSDGIQGQVEIGFALSETNNIEMWCWGPDGVNNISEYTGDLTNKGFMANIYRDETIPTAPITIYQIAMPWTFIGINGEAPENDGIIAFNLCVNNKDTNSGERTWYEFYGGIAENKDSSKFGLMTMYTKENIPPVTTTYTVTVTGGSGSGDYSEGETVKIEADEAAFGEQFKEWEINSELKFINNTNSTSATAEFEMPAYAINLTSKYEPIPNIITVNDIEIGYEIKNSITILDIKPEQMDDIIKAAEETDIVFDFSGFSDISITSDIDITVDISCFNNVDKIIVIKTDKGDIAIKTKTLWNNSGKKRVITIRNGKVEIKNK